MTFTKIKPCSACHLDFPREHYQSRATRQQPNKISSRCRTCTGQAKRAAKYDLSLEMMQELLAPGVCDICLLPCTALEVDHNHNTGVVRGVLCGPCNTGLALFRDQPDVLRRAAEYI